MHKRSIRELLAAQADASSAQQLSRHFLDRIAQHNDPLNSLVTVCAPRALQQAQAQDAAPAGAASLAGIPIVHKDAFCTRGVRTGCGSRMLDDFVAPYDAAAVAGLDAAGAITLGMANMDEFGMGSTSETGYHGAVRNPWQTDHVSGGSSGGSAAAVAAGLAAAATGSDTGGGIRQAAAWCGVTGIKPSYGRVSRHGLIAHASSLEQGGCLAHSAEDCARVLAAMAGHDARDATSANRPVADYVAQLGGGVNGLTVGIPQQYFGADLDPAVRTAVEQALHELERLGATLVDIGLPHTDVAMPTYYVLATAEASSNLARYDGVRYGHRCAHPQHLDDLYSRSRGEGFGSEVQRRILTGTHVLSADHYASHYIKAQRVRRLVTQDFASAFDQVDLIATPVTRTPACQLGEHRDDPVAMASHDVYTSAANLAGIPGLSLPAGFVQGLPVGLQLLAPWFEEGRLLNAGHALQQVTDWHAQWPQGFEQ